MVIAWAPQFIYFMTNTFFSTCIRFRCYACGKIWKVNKHWPKEIIKTYYDIADFHANGKEVLVVCYGCQ